MKTAGASASPAHSVDSPPIILIIDSDNALFGLIEEWLVACSFTVLRKTRDGDAAVENVAMIIVDLPFLRHEMTEAVRKITLQYPGVPVVALSSTFFPGITSHGTVAQSLGVSAVIAKPVKRDAFIEAVTRLLQ